MSQDNWSVLDHLRLEIDQADEAIIRAFAHRYAIREKIMALKEDQGLPVIDPVRAAAVVDRAVHKARECGVPEDFARALYELILEWSHQYEMNRQKKV